MFGVPHDEAALRAVVTARQWRDWGHQMRFIAVAQEQESLQRRHVAWLSDTFDKQFSALRGNEDALLGYLVAEHAIALQLIAAVGRGVEHPSDALSHALSQSPLLSPQLAERVGCTTFRRGNELEPDLAMHTEVAPLVPAGIRSTRLLTSHLFPMGRLLGVGHVPCDGCRCASQRPWDRAAAAAVAMRQRSRGQRVSRCPADYRRSLSACGPCNVEGPLAGPLTMHVLCG